MKNNVNYVIAIDAGGTYFKYALVDNLNNKIYGSYGRVGIDSRENSRSIFDTYQRIIMDCFLNAEKFKVEVTGVAVATPGPFDYKNGISLMKHKFNHIYGIRIRDELRKRAVLPADMDMRFIHDVHAFVLGEYWGGAARGYSNVLGITIGTGVGCGFIIDGRIFGNGKGGPYKSLYARPYKAGIVEDFVSGRGIVNIYQEISGITNIDIDAKEIGRLAEEENDQAAVRAYHQIGKILGKNIRDIVDDLNIECIVLGGQIARSFKIIKPGLDRELTGVKSVRKITGAKDIDNSALIGAAKTLL